MIDSIFIIGKPGSGKSIFIWYLSSLLGEDRVSIKYVSDRLGLEAKVLEDVKKVRVNSDGIKIGKHSKLIKDGPPGHRKVHVLDGFFLNQFHKETIKYLSNQPLQKKVLLVEYAIGPNIDFGSGKEPLLQDSHYFVELVKECKIINRVFVVDIEAPLAIREQREVRRPDAMAMETFQAYFPDGGEMKKQDSKILGKHYHRFKNHDEDHEGYFSEARYIYETLIRPKLNLKNI